MIAEPNAGMSLLDEAHAAWIAEDAEGAMQKALSVLEAAERQLGAAALVARILVARGRTDRIGAVASRLVEANVGRGDLPAAVCAANLVEGAERTELLGEIAEAFHQGSPRVTDVSIAPPPLPADATGAEGLAALRGDALWDRAESALEAFVEEDETRPEGSPLPRLPLFHALPKTALLHLLELMTLRDIDTGEVLIEQGSEGHEAFVVVRGMVEAVRRDGGGAEPVRLAALGPGAIFGEMALVSDAPRAASVSAIEPTQLLVASREALEKQAAKEPIIARELGEFCRQRMVSNLIRHGAILGAVDERSRADLVGRFEPKTFDAGDALIRQGQDAGALYLIASGAVDVRRVEEGEEDLLLAHLGPGNVVGEISLVLRREAVADVIATHQTVALELTRDRFQQAIKDHPQLLNHLYELATRREDETQSVVAQEALDVEDVVML